MAEASARPQPSRPPLGSGWGSAPGRCLAVVVLTALAVLGNIWLLPLFFGIHLLLGSTAAVLALLLWRGWTGLAMAALASLYTWKLWGHPWAIVIFTGELLWLSLAINRWNGPRSNDSNGQIILWDIAYWALIGVPLVLLFYGGVLQIDQSNVAVVAVKQALNGLVNTSLAFVIFLVLRLTVSRRSEQLVTLRGVFVALVLTAITVPTAGLTLIASNQLRIATQNGVLDVLSTAASAVAHTPPEDLRPGPVGTLRLGDVAYRRLDDGGQAISSDPALFARIDRDFRDGGRRYLHPRDLAILIPRRPMPLLKQWVNGYWAYSGGFDANGQPAPPGSATIEVQVLEPAKANVIRLQNQSSLMLSLFTTVLVAGALVSELVGRLVLSEFRKILQPLQVAGPGPGATEPAVASHLIPTLSLSAVGELRALVDQINARIARLNLLTGELQQANQALESSRDELATLSRTDSLTECLNRRALDDQLGTVLLQARRRGEPLSLLCFDIDHFKAINDSHGHPVGDLVLRTVADSVRTRLRATDAFFRIGGEEFVILLPDCSELDALLLAEQHRQLVSQAETAAPEGPLRVTISVGVSDFRPDSDTAESLMERVDRALYLAKRAGRNQVVHQ